MSDEKRLLPIKLVAPVVAEGLTVKEAIMKRRSTREFSGGQLSLKMLSEVMWAAYGVNRRATRGRTVPSAWALYPLEIYAITSEGAYLYEPEEHKLCPVAKGDLRAAAGVQDFVAGAALDIVVFANPSKMRIDDPAMAPLLEARKERIASLDAGAVAENVYLYAASAGLNIVERVSVDEEALKKALKITDDSFFVVALTLGYPL